MNTSTAFKTSEASRYLTALCQHFGRKVDTQCDARTGWVQFPFGRCDMMADETQLAMTASAHDQQSLDLIVNVVTNHLERFAFRENPTLTWETCAK